MLEANNCPNCGAALSVFHDYGRAFCDYCGSNFRVTRQVDLLSEQNGQVNEDCPKSISWEREPQDTLLFQERSSDVRSFVRHTLPLISGMSFCLKKSYAVVFHSDANLEDLADFKSDERLVHENTLFVRSSFFENNFPEIREIYDRVHNRDEITLIAEKLIKGLQEYELKCGDCPIF